MKKEGGKASENEKAEEERATNKIK